MDQETKLIREQALLLYGNVKCYFVDYFKYEFFFQGTAPDGAVVAFTYGRTADDIYRFSVSAGSDYRINDGWSTMNISKDGQVLFAGFNDE